MNTNNRSRNFSRRQILKYGNFALATGVTTLAISCQKETIQEPETAQKIAPEIEISPEMSPDEILAILMAGNKRFIENRRTSPHISTARLTAVANSQSPFATILSCSDSRVPIEIIFDRGLGDLFVVRNAGNIVTPEEMGSLEYGTAVLGSKVLMVLGHENCGAIKATMAGKPVPGQIGSIIAAIKPAVEAAKGMPGKPVENAVKANVIQQINIIKSSPVINQLIKGNQLKVVGGYYDLDLGKVYVIS